MKDKISKVRKSQINRTTSSTKAKKFEGQEKNYVTNITNIYIIENFQSNKNSLATQNTENKKISINLGLKIFIKSIIDTIKIWG